MAESEIHADPVRIAALAENLKMFSNSFRTELINLEREIQKLGNTWQDEEYKKFKHSFEGLKTELEKLSKDIARREPELREDAQLLAQYIKNNTP